MGPEFFLKLLEKYGWAVAVTAILAGVISWLFKLLINEKNARIKELSESNKAKDEAAIASRNREIEQQEKINHLADNLVELNGSLRLLLDRLNR